MFNGSIVALVTPMDALGAIDYESFERLLDWHLGQGTEGVVVLGTTGESATINSAERRRLIEMAVDLVKSRIPIMVGTGANATDQAILLTREALELGADAALVVTPYYNKPTQEGLYQHFKAIAKAVPLPQILYNVPSRTACDLLPETVCRLAPLPNIIGIKEATGDISRAKAILANDPSLDVFSGDDATALELMLSGAKGVISVAANVAPRLFQAMCHAVLSGDDERARALNLQLQPLYAALFLESNPIPTKWALASMGMMSGGIRLPLTPLSERFHATVQQAVAQVGV